MNMAIAAGVLFQIFLMVFLGRIKIFEGLVFHGQGLVILFCQGL